jgi:hypothetical protein
MDKGKRNQPRNILNCTTVMLLGFVGAIWIFALLPWLVSGFRPQVLVPEDLLKEPEYYQNTVEVAQQSTVDASRQSTSAVHIRPLKTIVATETAESTNTSDLSATSIPLQQTSIVIVSTADGNMHSTIEIGSDHTPVDSTPTATPDLTVCELEEPAYLPSTPSILKDVQDILTEESLIEQLSIDAENSDFENIEVFLSTDGIQIASELTVLPGLTQEVYASGVLTIQQDSLRIVLFSITTGGMDVTTEYCKSLQTRLNTSIYRLLPERFVQDFELHDGEIIVYSKVRP